MFHHERVRTFFIIVASTLSPNHPDSIASPEMTVGPDHFAMWYPCLEPLHINIYY